MSPKSSKLDEIPRIRRIGYARVSTADQNPDMQIAALKAYGVQEELIFVDKASGGSVRRPQFLRALQLAQIPDTEFVVWKLDRLGRTLYGILETMELLERRGVKFISLTERIDTSGPMGKAMIRLLAVFAELERDLTRERTTTGIRRKIQRGEHHGRAHSMTAERKEVAELLLERGERGNDVWKMIKSLRGPPISRAAYYVWQKKYDDRKALERADLAEIAAAKMAEQEALIEQLRTQVEENPQST
jgi:DNA invertase Pin-like site-specific DNA recombinase